MKICITSEGQNLDAVVDPRFGRCKYFIIVDPVTLEFEAIANANLDASQGAGIKSAQLMEPQNVQTVLTGRVGPNATQTLESLNIKVISDISGTVKEVIENYNNGKY